LLLLLHLLLLLLMLFVFTGVTAGYGDEVIFADGTFIDGSTAELSADGPIRPPYVVYCQGGTHWTHWALALESALVSLAESGVAPPAAAAAGSETSSSSNSSSSSSELQEEQAVLVC
jgi:hypothetical protein